MAGLIYTFDLYFTLKKLYVGDNIMIPILCHDTKSVGSRLSSLIIIKLGR